MGGDYLYRYLKNEREYHPFLFLFFERKNASFQTQFYSGIIFPMLAGFVSRALVTDMVSDLVKQGDVPREEVLNSDWLRNNIT